MLAVSRLPERRSLANTLLSRSSLLRLAYMDEAGISNPKEEPVLVVSGFVINADQDWQRLVWHLKSIVRQTIPVEDRRRFVFHAKDIWHGSGYFKRDKWPLPKRIELLEKIVSIPKTFHLPVVAGFIYRLDAETLYRNKNPHISAKTIQNLVHGEAYLDAIEDVNFWMRQNALNEVGMIIAENNDQTKAAIKILHDSVTDEEDEFWLQRFSKTKNLYQIVDTVHFAEKEEAALLQIADACSFVIKRHLMGKTDTAALFDLLRDQVVSSRPMDWKYPRLPGFNPVSQAQKQA